MTSQSTGAIRPDSKGAYLYSAFRRVSPNTYPSAYAVLVEYFELDPQNAQNLLPNDKNDTVTFSTGRTVKGIWGALRDTHHQWFPVVADLEHVFTDPEQARAYALAVCRAQKGQASDWFILRQAVPTPAHLH